MPPLTGPSALSGQDSLALSLQLSPEETPALMGRRVKCKGALAGGCGGAAGSAGRGHPTTPRGEPLGGGGGGGQGRRDASLTRRVPLAGGQWAKAEDPQARAAVQGEGPHYRVRSHWGAGWGRGGAQAREGPAGRAPGLPPAPRPHPLCPQLQLPFPPCRHVCVQHRAFHLPLRNSAPLSSFLAPVPLKKCFLSLVFCGHLSTPI